MLALVAIFGWSSPGPASAGTAVRTSSFEYNTTTGLLTKEIVEPDQTQFRLETLYTYDAFGNKTQATVSSPAIAPAAIASRSSTNTYTADGRFVVTSANALSHQETKQFDPYFGQVVSLTGPNQLTTTWTYDSFGRKLTEVRADGTKTKWEYFYCSSLGIPASAVAQSSACPADLTNAKYFVQVNTLTTADVQIGPGSRVYYDILGREIRSEVQGFDGSTPPSPNISKDTVYDIKARVQKTSRPYYNGTAANNIKWTSYTYDAIGRATVETYPDSSTTQFTYTGLINGTSVTATNSLSQTKTTIKNSQAQVVQVKDTQTNTITYVYDPFGNLVKTTDSAGNVTTATFDIRGRKTAMSDPDMGTWTYLYDALGQLVKQTDAKSHITTMIYDVLGRMTSRTEPERVNQWVYDTSVVANGKTIGKLVDASAGATNFRHMVYDDKGRVIKTERWIDQLPASGPGYAAQTIYNTAGRVDTQIYPSGFTVYYVYTALGYLKEVRKDGPTGNVLWQANALDAEGNLLTQTYGNGIATTQTFDTNTGRLTAIQAGASNAVQNQSYVWDTIGNLTSRTDATQSVTETFLYDTLNRVTSAAIGANAQTVQYNAIGNITFKSDVGTYSYPTSGLNSVRPHAVTGVTTPLNTTYTYDANGNMISGAGRTVTYTSFNMPASITRGAKTISFDYDAEHNRTKQIASDGTTLYFGPSTGFHAEKLTGPTGTVRWTNYIHAGGGMVAAYYEQTTSGGGGGGGSGPFYNGSDDHGGQTIMGTSATTDTVVYPRPRSYYTINTETSPDYYGTPTGGLWFTIWQTGGGIDSALFVERAQFTDQTITLATGQPVSSGTTTTTYLRYFHKDHLGSISVITNEAGTVVERLSYDPWGKRRFVNGSADAGETIISSTDRGYTGHEHLEDVGLIHMNGRIYDPVLGRFMSADPYIQDPSNTQSFNRYSYVLNNPLAYTDPTGYFSFKKFFKKNPFVGAIIGIAASFLLGPAGLGLTAGLMTLEGAVIAGAISGALSGGLKGALFGAIAGAASGIVASSQFAATLLEKAIVTGAMQGVLAEMQGTKFGPAFLATLASSGMNYGLSKISAFGGENFNSVFGRSITGAVVGGTASAIGGGKFQNGAATGAFQNALAYVEGQQGTNLATATTGACGCADRAKTLDDAIEWIIKSIVDALSVPQTMEFRHYGYASDDVKFRSGMRPWSFVTDAEGAPMTGREAQDRLALDKIYAPNAYYVVTVQRTSSGAWPVAGPYTVQPILEPVFAGRPLPGGGTEYRLPFGTPPGSVRGPYFIAP